MDFKGNVCTVRIFLTEGNIAVCNNTVSAVKIPALDRDCNFVLPCFDPKSGHDRRSIRQFRSGRDDLVDCTVFHSKIQAVIEDIISPLDRHLSPVFHFGCLLTQKPHIILHLFVFVQIVMIYRRTSGYCLIRIQCHDRFKSEKFFQAIVHHIKL